ncbi:MAG: hypothetical protein KUG77_13270 [Nannocystaceae bacterium]|nr:hypothetical protein [Nannocystaceae bacterium]
MQRLLPYAALVTCLLPALALASEGNQAVDACKTSSEGEACVLKEPTKGAGGVSYRDIDGTCQPDECCEQDYSKGSPPEVTCSECLACKPGDGPSPTVMAEPTAGGEPPKAGVGDDPPASAGNKRGCTAGGTASWTSLLWLLPLVWTRRR